MPYGLVKDADETNEKYLDSISMDNPWRDTLWDAHNRMQEVDPDYQVVQVKEKFNRLRYYWTASEGATDEMKAQMSQIVADAEDKISVIQGRNIRTWS